MACLASSIIGNVIGSELQPAVGWIPIPEDTWEGLDMLRVSLVNWFSTNTSSSNKQNPQPHVCEKIGQQIAEALQVIGQEVQVAKVLGHVLSPQTGAAPAKASTPRDDLVRANVSSYISAHNRSLGPTYKLPKNHSGLQCPRVYVKTAATSVLDAPSTVKLKENFSFLPKPMYVAGTRKTQDLGKTFRYCQKNTGIYTVERKTIRQITNTNGGKPLAIASKIMPKGKGRKYQFNVCEESKDRTFCRSSMVTNQFPLPKGQKNTANTQYKTRESGVQKCLYSQVQSKKVNKSGLMPFERVLCQRCLTGQRPLKCPNCDQIYEEI